MYCPDCERRYVENAVGAIAEASTIAMMIIPLTRVILKWSILWVRVIPVRKANPTRKSSRVQRMNEVPTS